KRTNGRVKRFLTVEHRTSNVEHRIFNKVFCQFINWRSDPPASPEGEADGGQERFHHSMFNVRCSMFDVQKTLYSAVLSLFDTIDYIYSRRNGKTF
ncbi:MAG: hypothetical protein KKC23_10150, partial [Proteobacteria bacterium]|nr:hypothetical protein [Pseudomonadota bacterium]